MCVVKRKVLSMSLAVNPVINQSNQATFKGKWDKTDNGTPYYKSNSATIAGGVMAVPAAIDWLININKKSLTQDKDIEEVAKNPEMKKQVDSFLKIFGVENSFEEVLKEQNKINQRLKKYAVPFAIIAAGLTAGCGVLVDNLRNKKAQELADYVKQNGIKKTLMEQDRVAISNKGRAYYESNQGRKWGALLGAGCGITAALMQSGRKTKIAHMFTGAASYAFGGWIMGMIADRNTNKNAKIHS